MHLSAHIQNIKKSKNSFRYLSHLHTNRKRISERMEKKNGGGGWGVEKENKYYLFGSPRGASCWRIREIRKHHYSHVTIFPELPLWLLISAPRDPCRLTALCWCMADDCCSRRTACNGWQGSQNLAGEDS